MPWNCAGELRESSNSGDVLTHPGLSSFFFSAWWIRDGNGLPRVRKFLFSVSFIRYFSPLRFRHSFARGNEELRIPKEPRKLPKWVECTKHKKFSGLRIATPLCADPTSPNIEKIKNFTNQRSERWQGADNISRYFSCLVFLRRRSKFEVT